MALLAWRYGDLSSPSFHQSGLRVLNINLEANNEIHESFGRFLNQMDENFVDILLREKEIISIFITQPYGNVYSVQT